MIQYLRRQHVAQGQATTDYLVAGLSLLLGTRLLLCIRIGQNHFFPPADSALLGLPLGEGFRRPAGVGVGGEGSLASCFLFANSSARFSKIKLFLCTGS